MKFRVNRKSDTRVWFLFLDRVLNIDETVKAAFIEIAQNKKRKRGKKKKEEISDATANIPTFKRRNFGNVIPLKKKN